MDDAELVNKLPGLFGTPTVRRYPEPDEPSPHTHTLLNIHLQTSLMVYSFCTFPPKRSVNSSLRQVLHSPSISNLTWSKSGETTKITQEFAYACL